MKYKTLFSKINKKIISKRDLLKLFTQHAFALNLKYLTSWLSLRIFNLYENADFVT